MKTIQFKDGFKRREFCKIAAIGGLAVSFSGKYAFAGETPKTNIADALKIPKTDQSLPGKYPGKVVAATHSKSVVNNKPDIKIVRALLTRAMQELTSEKSIDKAWLKFVNPTDRIALKVNPVAGKLLSTSLELTNTVIEQLVHAGVARENIVIWDRREFQLHEAGFTAKNFPGIKIYGQEYQDAAGSFFDENGKLFAEQRIDRDWFYWADCEMKYDAETLPYMINEGKKSYFSRLLTGEVDKVINLPILKNAGSSITLCLKNLAYGSISNTARLHRQLWSETCAEVPCFLPLRDKVVLNIVDGFRGCYNGGPGANPQFFTNYNTLLVGTDPVAVDRKGYEMVLQKRIEEKLQEAESERGTKFLTLAEANGLGIGRPDKIDFQKMNMG